MASVCAMSCVCEALSGLGRPAHLVLQRILLIAQIADFAAQLIVLTLQVLQLGENVVQLVEPLENLRAAFFLFLRAGQQTVQLIRRCVDDVVDAAFLDHLAAAVGECQNDAAVHEPAFLGPVVHFRSAFAVARGADLVVGYAVLHQERLHGIRPLHARACRCKRPNPRNPCGR